MKKVGKIAPEQKNRNFPLKNIALFIGFLLVINLGLAQTGQPPAFGLSSGDVLVFELFIYKQADGTTEFLKLNYTKEKSVEFSKIAAANLGKKITIVLNGKTVSDTEVSKPGMGQSIDVKMTSPEEAFEIAKAFMNTPAKPATALVQAAGAPVLSLMPADVHKIVIMMFRDHTELEVTYAKEKQAEFAKVTAEGLPKKFEIVLNGKMVAERTITKPMTGHSLRVEMPSPEEAFAMAKALINPVPKPETKAP